MLFNIAQSQVAWFTCVLSAAAGYPWLGTLVALTLTAVCLLRPGKHAPQSLVANLLLVLATGVFGATADSLLLQSGLLVFTSGIAVPGLAPYWMIALWLNFATVLNGALRWLQPRPLLAALIGAVAGPASYYAGVRLGALDFTDTAPALAAVAIEWAIALPLLSSLARHLGEGTGKRRRITRLPGPILLLACTTAIWPAQHTSAASAPRQWHYTVSLDGRKIGHHDFTVIADGAEQRVTSTAQFRVKALFLELYRYEHEAHETWQDGCLVSLDARTNDGGERLQVNGARQGSAFRVSGGAEPGDLDACVWTFAYWNPQFLRQQRLLNTQTGRYESVDIVRRGLETIDVRGVPQRAVRHSVRAGGYVIDVWHSAQGEWLALRSTTPQGRLLSYDLAATEESASAGR